jgi:chorismate mutase
MRTYDLNALAGVICAAQTQDRTPMGIAFAIESAGMLQSPETAAEMQRLRVMYDVADARTSDLIDERDALLARVAELETAAAQIRHLHKDSPMGPCPVCVDGGAMARGDDYTVPYPCPTARLVGATDCVPTHSVDEDPIAYSLTEAACSCGPQMRCPQGHCSRHYMCQDCGNCCSCRCAGGQFVEALHASSGAVIETPSRREQATAKLRDLLARQQQAAAGESHETTPRPRPVPHDLPEVTP